MNAVISNNSPLAINEELRSELQALAAEKLATDEYKGQHSGDLTLQHNGKTYSCRFNRGSGVVDVVINAIVHAVGKAVAEAVTGAIDKVVKRVRNRKPSEKKAARRAKRQK